MYNYSWVSFFFVQHFNYSFAIEWIFKNYRFSFFLFCIDLFANWHGDLADTNVITRKGIKSPTPSFRSSVMKVLVVETGMGPDNYCSFGLCCDACGSHWGHSWSIGTQVWYGSQMTILYKTFKDLNLMIFFYNIPIQKALHISVYS